MKNRKLVITAFLLLATMILGVGYAQVSGNLNVGGGAEFYGHTKTNTDIQDAIKFTSVESQTANVVDAKISSDKQATFDVLFTDVSDAVDTFTAEIVYKVKYDSTDEDLPDVTLSVNAITVNQMASGSFPEGWTVTADFGKTQLTPGEETTVTVTVQYINQTGDDLANINYPITITLNYSTGTNP